MMDSGSPLNVIADLPTWVADTRWMLDRVQLSWREIPTFSLT